MSALAALGTPSARVSIVHDSWHGTSLQLWKRWHDVFPINSAFEVGVGVEVEGSKGALHSFIHRHGWPVSERVIDTAK